MMRPSHSIGTPRYHRRAARYQRARELDTRNNPNHRTASYRPKHIKHDKGFYPSRCRGNRVSAPYSYINRVSEEPSIWHNGTGDRDILVPQPGAECTRKQPDILVPASQVVG